uniref:Uncharacterized protein n=1 Tax=Cyprinus carpio TaxID=7962 RepID=A0A8C2ENH8_CYPCA
HTPAPNSTHTPASCLAPSNISERFPFVCSSVSDSWIEYSDSDSLLPAPISACFWFRFWLPLTYLTPFLISTCVPDAVPKAEAIPEAPRHFTSPEAIQSTFASPQAIQSQVRFPLTVQSQVRFPLTVQSQSQVRFPLTVQSQVRFPLTVQSQVRFPLTVQSQSQVRFPLTVQSQVRSPLTLVNKVTTPWILVNKLLTSQISLTESPSVNHF